MHTRSYHPAWWIPSPHLRTLWGKFCRPFPRIPLRRERWDTADSDFLDLYRLDTAQAHARLLILHGLEGSPRSHYARGLIAQARSRGWAADVLVFRSCGAEPNRALRSYHSGETTDLDFVVRRLVMAEPECALVITGVSLGGNVLLKWLGERADDLPAQLRGAAAISVPYDLARGAQHISRGFSRIYQAHFLRSLKRKAHEKRTRFPDCLSAHAIDAARTLRDFDDAVTAPLHGFRDADDYYTRSSAIGFLASIRLPTLLLSAADDPFLPASVLHDVAGIAAMNPCLHPEFVERGGHVGFISGRLPWKPLYYAEWRACDFLARCVETGRRA
ncbi:MAG TPA: alpha/beta fold hydrolase [Gemmatimonadaceae bacterium]|nr:alpha/beta fold hydrolase [Gemmatimonadaceae bacterium]